MHLPLSLRGCWKIGVLATLSCGCFFQNEVPAASAERADSAQIDFSRDIRPIFNKNCVACHGGVKRANGVSFIVREHALAETKSGAIPIQPGDPEHSEMIRRVASKEDDERMPPPEHGPALSEAEIARLREWIRQGAEWKEHWAYVPLKPQPRPLVSGNRWSRQPLDDFVLNRLKQEKLKPSREADRLQWLRRVSFDLTGLPPTPEEARAFVSDRDKAAHVKVVDRLLSSPAYGERWATVWMDLARYADTQGYEKDPGRTVWPYRDWLIRSLNDDMPYDQFTVRQLAGDLLPDATLEDRVATVFHRNTQTNTEGGTDDEEFRVSAVLDRVNTTWEAWQGVTFRCVQCHSHPYDPIDHADYYRFSAFFNTSRDWDLQNDAPLLRVPTNTVDYPKAQALDQKLAVLRAEERRQTDAVVQRTASEWQPLQPAKAVSTKLTTLALQPEGGHVEVVTRGTVSHGSRFTIDIPATVHTARWTALRLEALPVKPESARLTPEWGFALSQIRAYVVTAEAKPAEVSGGNDPPPNTATETVEKNVPEANQASRKEIRFAYVLGDESEPFQDPDASLNANAQGWGPMPRIDRLRQAVFVAAEPVEIPVGGSLQLTLSFDAAAGDQAPQVMNRGRFSVSNNEEWTRLAKDEVMVSRRQEMATVRRERAGIGSVEIPVMSEQDDRLRRVTSMFVRGNWLDKGAVVEPGVPRLFPNLPEGAETNRLALARWLVSPGQPLTARVAVNRLWEQLFGVGIVETLEDFGSSGTLPSHPELLDFLALRFQNELGWSTKMLLREIALSATYRQDAALRPELATKDPRNRLLARGPRTRLTAEMVRDQALRLSGLLSAKMYGPPVMPPQPEGIWRSVYSSARWETSPGEDRYRRAVYTYWKRTASYPSFAMFDSPNRSVCTARRLPTNTPLQALVTLNDPVYLECAKALANQVTAVEMKNLNERINQLWALTVGGQPSAADRRSLTDLYRRSLQAYQNTSQSQELADPPERAALTIVANALLNLDEVLTK